MLFRDKVIRGNLETRLGMRYIESDWVYFKAAILSEVFRTLEKYDIDYTTEFNNDNSDTAWLVDESFNYNESLYSYLPRTLPDSKKDKAVEYIIHLAERAVTYILRQNLYEAVIIIYPNNGFRIW